MDPIIERGEPTPTEQVVEDEEQIQQTQIKKKELSQNKQII